MLIWLSDVTYDDAITFLFSSLPVWERSGAAAYKPGLERISGFIEFAGVDEVPTIHVAGTNGKGSVASMLAAILTSAGYRTGLFTSPHLVDFRERIRVDGEMIPEGAVVEFTERWGEEMAARGLTFFEMTTAMGLWWFERQGVDIAVIEAGLGGRLDSTNIITPLVSVITNIGLEHTQYLGDTIAEIAAEKAGIIKPGVPVVIGEADPESEPVFRARAAEMGAPIIFSQESRVRSYESDLVGDHQRTNIHTVLAVIKAMGNGKWEIENSAIRQGLARVAALTGLRGRWEVLGTEPLVVCDTAHNAHGFEQIVKQLAGMKYEKLYMVLGFAADKDLDAIIPLLPTDAHYILTQADSPRALPVEELAKQFSTHHSSLSTLNSVPAAVARARELAGPRDVIYIGGSNFIVGELLKTCSGKRD